MTFCKISKDISWLLFYSIQKLVILRKCLDLYWFLQICNSLLKGLKYIKIIKWIIKMSNKHCTLGLLSGSTSCSWIPVPADSYCPFPLVVLNLIISKDSHSVFMNTSTGAYSFLHPLVVLFLIIHKDSHSVFMNTSTGADSFLHPLVVLFLIIHKDSHSVFMNTSTGADSIRSFYLSLTTQLCSVFLKTFFTPTF